MDKISKTHATLNDVEFARNVHHRAFRDVVTEHFGEWNQKGQDEFFEDAWKQGEHQILTYNGERCGYISVDENDEKIILNEIVLLPEYQNKGIGSDILNELISSSNEKHKALELQVLKNNKAVGLYIKKGFNTTKETDDHYYMRYTPH